jgi:predicted RNA-binding protein with PIN domain
MEIKYKMLRIRLSSWNKLRRVFYGRKNETFSDYIERIAKELKNENTN